MKHHDLPPVSLGEDPSTVAGFTTSSHHAAARLFLPILGPDDGSCWSWSDLCERARLPLTPTTRWSELSEALPDDLSIPLEPPYGWLAPSMTDVLVAVLTGATATPDSCVFSLWFHDQVAREGVDAESYPAWLAPLDGPFDHQVLHTGPLTWLSERMRPNPWRHHNLMPVFIMPEDRSFLLGCPIYHDSIYVSSDIALLDALRAGGFDVLEIDRHEDLPSEGD